MTSLYTIAAQYRADLDTLADMDLDEQTITDTLEGMQGDLREKLRSCISWARSHAVLAAATKQAAKGMADLAASRDKRAQMVLDYALRVMQESGIGEENTAEWRAKVAKKPPAVRIDDPFLLPEQYWRQPPLPAKEPDKGAIATALKDGQQVPGASLVHGFRLKID